MAPCVDLITWAMPEFPCAARAECGQLIVEELPSFHTLGSAVCRNREKFAVVPDESARTTVVIGVLGRLTPGLSAVIAGLFQVVMLPWKMFAMTVGSSFRLLTPCRLYDIVMGPMTTGKYRIVLPAKLDASVDGIGESEPAKLTTPDARSLRPLPEPPPP